MAGAAQVAASAVTLRTRTYRQASEVGRPARSPVSAADGGHQEVAHPFDPARSALILIDVWATHPVADWDARAQANVREHLLPLLRCCRQAGLTIVHAPHGMSGDATVQDRRPRYRPPV
jgi:hypothetical protein